MNDQIDVNTVIKSLATKLSEAQVSNAVLEAQLEQANAKLLEANQRIAKLENTVVEGPAPTD